MMALGPCRHAVPGAAPAVPAVPAAAVLDRVRWGRGWHHPDMAGDTPDGGDVLDLLEDAFDVDPAILRRVLVDDPKRFRWETEA